MSHCKHISDLKMVGKPKSEVLKKLLHPMKILEHIKVSSNGKVEIIIPKPTYENITPEYSPPAQQNNEYLVLNDVNMENQADFKHLDVNLTFPKLNHRKKAAPDTVFNPQQNADLSHQLQNEGFQDLELANLNFQELEQHMENQTDTVFNPQQNVDLPPQLQNIDFQDFEFLNLNQPVENLPQLANLENHAPQTPEITTEMEKEMNRTADHMLTLEEIQNTRQHVEEKMNIHQEAVRNCTRLLIVLNEREQIALNKFNLIREQENLMEMI